MYASSTHGILKSSDMYFFSPTETAQRLYYYLTSCGYFYCVPGYSVDRGNNGNYLLLYVVKGKLPVTSQGRTHVVESGQAAFINCHLPHEYHAVGNVEFVWLHFNGANSALFHEYITKELYGSIVFPGDNSVFKEMLAITMLNRHGQIVSEAEYSGHLYNLLILLVNSVGQTIPESSQNPAINDVIEYITRHLDGDLTVKTLSAHINMSPYHFSRFFKKMTGNSPHEYVVMCRLNRAKHLLKTSDLSIKEIAYQVGYNSPSNFITSFNTNVGVPPGKFRDDPI